MRALKNTPVEKAFEDDESILGEIIEISASTLSSKNGCIIVIADINGDGEVTTCVGGNAFLTEPLMSSTYEIFRKLFKANKEQMQ